MYLCPLGEKTGPVTARAGSAQGDPMSGLLFNWVMDDLLEAAAATWKTRASTLGGERLGVQIANGRNCFHVIWADDVLLFSESAAGVIHMIESVRSQISIAGLRLARTKIQWTSLAGGPPSLLISGVCVPKSDTLTFLGCAIDVQRLSCEPCVSAAISKGWARFNDLSRHLRARVSVIQRTRLLEACVGVLF